MTNEMFCFQCEQTAGCTGCTGRAGVCGKSAQTALLQDELTGALIGLARAVAGNEHLVTPELDRLVMHGLFATLTNVNFDDNCLKELTDRVHTAKLNLAPSCTACGSPCGRSDDYDMNSLWTSDEDIRSLKSLILFGIRGVAAYAYHADVLGYTDPDVNRFFYKALFIVGSDSEMQELLPVVLEVGETNLKCMALLDKANTETFGDPEPTEVTLTVEKGPFIVITGHDLYD